MAEKIKRIFFEYLEIENEIYENNKVRISKNAPKYDNYKELYLYELFSYDFLEDKIKNQLHNNFLDCQYYDSFMITLTSDEFEQIKILFEQESDLEKDKKSDDINRMLLFLNTSVKMAQKDPKFWEV